MAERPPRLPLSLHLREEPPSNRPGRVVWLALGTAALAVLLSLASGAIALSNRADEGEAESAETVPTQTLTLTPSATPSSTPSPTPTPTVSPTPEPTLAPQPAFSLSLVKADASAEAYIGSNTPLILLVQASPANNGASVRLRVDEGQGQLRFPGNTQPASDNAQTMMLTLDASGNAQAAFVPAGNPGTVVIVAEVQPAPQPASQTGASAEIMWIEAARLTLQTRRDVLRPEIRLAEGQATRLNSFNNPETTVTVILHSPDTSPSARTYSGQLTFTIGQAPITIAGGAGSPALEAPNLSQQIQFIPNREYTYTLTLNPVDTEPFSGEVMVDLALTVPPTGVEAGSQQQNASLRWEVPCVLTPTAANGVTLFRQPQNAEENAYPNARPGSDVPLFATGVYEGGFFQINFLTAEGQNEILWVQDSVVAESPACAAIDRATEDEN